MCAVTYLGVVAHVGEAAVAAGRVTRPRQREAAAPLTQRGDEVVTQRPGRASDNDLQRAERGLQLLLR